jgi:nitronate monooxygenase
MARTYSARRRPWRRGSGSGDEVDAVLAQGAEAGGHRGTFLGNFEDSLIGTMALVPQMVDALSVPVIAAGGVMDGRGLAAALTLGAEAVQMGTAFLTCKESGAHPAFKKAVLKASEDETAVTRAFSGRAARGIKNRFLVEVGAREGEIAPFPVHNALTRDVRAAAHSQNRPEFMSLWAGQGMRLARHHGGRASRKSRGRTIPSRRRSPARGCMCRSLRRPGLGL